MNEYYQAWMEHQNPDINFQHPPNVEPSSGAYWTAERAIRIHQAARQTQSAFTMAGAIAAVDGPLPFADVIAFTAAGAYSAAWWNFALA